MADFIFMPEISRYPPEAVRAIDHRLRQIMADCGRVTDFENGHLFLPWITDRIDTRMQHLAAKLIVHQLDHLTEDAFDGVISVPFMGTFLANPLAEELNIPLIVSRKGTFTPHTWENPLIIPNKRTKNGTVVHHAYNIHAGEKIVLTDDMLGDGTTIIPVIEQFTAHGINIEYVAAYVIKLFRPGYQALKNMGITPIGAYYVEGLAPDGQIILKPPMY